MPNQEIMREWVARLRSGDYPQGRGALNVDGQFCCLGVLCQIAADEGVIPQPNFMHEMPGYNSLPPIPALETKPGPHTIAMYEGATTMPTHTVYQWAGIDAAPATMDEIDLRLYARKLADLNDSGKTFAEIADLIEENWIDLPADVVIPDSPEAITEPDKESVDA